MSKSKGPFVWIPKYLKLIAQCEQRFGYDLNRDDSLRLLNRFNVPVLIIHDRDDRIFPFRNSKAADSINGHLRRLAKILLYLKMLSNMSDI
jgi:pimeloyl-ACP methyl ester carboxylesterase